MSVPTPAAMLLCVLMYTPTAGSPAHLGEVLRVKGIELPAGKQVTVSAAQAGLILRAAPEGTIQVVSGEPVHVATLPAGAKAAKRKLDDHVAAFAADPSKALQAIAPIGEDVLKVLRGKEAEAVKHVVDGKVDHLLGEIMIWAQLGARTALATAAGVRTAALLAQGV